MGLKGTATGRELPKTRVLYPLELRYRTILTVSGTTVFTDATVQVFMVGIPKPTSPLEIAAVSVGALVGLLVVVPLVPLLLDFTVGLFRGVFDVIVPK